MFGKMRLYGLGVVLFALVASYSTAVSAQTAVHPKHSPEAWLEVCKDWDEWDKPAPPFNIFGNTYYVGTCGISAILITDAEGLILIDTGTRKGAEVVAKNIEALGFDLADVNVILHSHEHHDHVGGFAWMKEKTGARVIASPKAAPVLRSGVAAENDPQSGLHEAMEPVEVDSVIQNEIDYFLVGQSVTLWTIPTPGHTPGALSWTWRSCEGAVCIKFVYADSLSPISKDGYKFSDHPDYLAAFRDGLSRLASADCDALLTPHPSSSDMVDRMHGPNGLLSPGMCQSYARGIEKRLDARLAKEAAGE